jgi:hypothetical protein
MAEREPAVAGSGGGVSECAALERHEERSEADARCLIQYE